MKQEQLDALRHSCAHLLAAAVLKLYPNTKRAIGPAISDGFYYDFEFMQPITEEDLKRIENVMRQIAPTWKTFEKKDVSKDDAKKLFADNPYKLELIDEFSTAGQKLTIYTSGEYVDLCRGGHEDKPSENLKNFKLLKIAGAYWRGNEKNKMLTRIYGTAFYSKEELDQYLTQQEEAKKRDHRKLGKELDLFVFSDLVGSGMPLFTPKGFILRNEIISYSRELNKRIGYQEVHTPNINKAELFKISGHYDKYHEDMLRVKSQYSQEDFFLKPMNCPQHIQIYASQKRSYRELPIRYCDFAVLYRDERPGELSGLTRLRSFSQDDGHCLCTEAQIGEEFKNVLEVIKEALKTYGLKYWIRLSLRDPNQKEKYLGDDATWERAQKTLKELLVEGKIKFKEAEGEAAFYGPKMDIMAVDALGREWQISTIQLDLNLPSRFEITYTDADNSEKTPVMIHRAIVGSPDRFLGILIEHYGGRFPLWLSPVQVRVVTITDRSNDYAQAFVDELKEKGIRAELDTSAESMGKKVRNAETEKIPLIVTIGDKEMENKTLAIRYQGKNIFGYDTKKFISTVTAAIKKRKEEIKLETPSPQPSTA